MRSLKAWQLVVVASSLSPFIGDPGLAQSCDEGPAGQSRIRFERNSSGGPLCAGTRIGDPADLSTQPYAGWGIRIDVDSNCLAIPAGGMVFDSACPVLTGPLPCPGTDPLCDDQVRGDDPDLGSANNMCPVAGPGVGVGGTPCASRMPPATPPCGEHCDPVGHVLIIQENTLTGPARPDDCVSGGEIVIDFFTDSGFGTATEVRLDDLSTLDIEDTEALIVRLFDDAGTLFRSGQDCSSCPAIPDFMNPCPCDITAVGYGDNAYELIPIDETGVHRIEAFFSGSGSLDDFIFCRDITVSTVNAFSVEPSGDGHLVSWSTSSEVGKAGFELLRWDGSGGRYRRVNREMIVGFQGAPQGGVYSFLDLTDAAEAEPRYLLQEVELGGRVRQHGPFPAPGVSSRVPESPSLPTLAPGEASGRPYPPLSVAAVEVAALHPGADEHRTVRAPRGPKGFRPVKLFVDGAGLQFASATELSAAAGVRVEHVVDLIEKGKLALSSGGAPVAWRGVGEPPGIQFYGQPPSSVYTSSNVYWLASASGGGVQMGELDADPGSAGATVDSFRADRHHEENLFAATVVATDPDSDYWMWEFLVAGSTPFSQREFDIETEALAAGPEASLTVHLFGATAALHRADISLNGSPLGEVQWQGTGPYSERLAFHAGLLFEGLNRVTVSALGGSSDSIFYVNAFDSSYPRRLEIEDGSLHFTAQRGDVVTVRGFSNDEIALYSLYQPQRPDVLAGLRIEGETGGGYRATFRAPVAGDYLALESAGVRPAPVRPDASAGLNSRNNRADYLIVTVPELESPAYRLAELRAADGLRVRVVLLEQILDEFSHGLFRPLAIRDFLRFAHRSWKQPPRYVVMGGAGHFDYKDYLGLGHNPLPPALAPTSGGLFGSDNLLADLEGGDGVPEMVIGRLPFSSAAEFEDYLDKLEAYQRDHGTWRREAVFAADDFDLAGRFGSLSNALAAQLSDDWHVSTVHLDDLPVADARQELLSALQSGAAWMNYLGHGSLDRLAAEGLLTSADVGGLFNGSRLPFVASLTCVAGRFEVPGFRSLAEVLVAHPGGGAVGVWSPSGLSDNHLATLLNSYLLMALEDPRNPRVGDAVREALVRLGELGDTPRHGSSSILGEMLLSYVLLGDPAVSVRP